MIYYEKIEMTWALKLNESFPLRIIKPNENQQNERAKIVSLNISNISNILKIIDDNINYYLAPSYIKILTDEQRHKILQNLAWNEDLFKKLTDKEKLKILERLFIWDEKKLENLSDTEKLWIFDKLLEWNKEKKVENLSDNEKNKILYDLFFWEEWKLDSSFLYKWSWAKLYEKIINDKSYKFIDIELSILGKLSWNKKFKKILENLKYITDVWTWNWNKPAKLLGQTNRDWTLILEDVSAEMLDIAKNTIQNNAKHIKLWNSQILNTQQHLTSVLDKNMFMFLWWTICNMSDEQIINELKNMDNNWIFTWNKILLSYFTAPNTLNEIKKLIEIYNSENNIAFHENGMKMLWLSKDDFEYDTIYELDNWTKLKLENWKLKPYEWTLNDSLKWPFSWRIKGIIRAKKDLKLDLSEWWKKIIRIWDEFTLHYSRRFTKEKIEDLFKKSGCETNYTDSDKWVSVAILGKAPTKSKKFINKYKKSLITALVALTVWFWSWVGTNIYYQNKKEAKQNEMRIGLAIDGKTLDYHPQESLELISALNLDKLKNKKDKETIISLFNKYLWEHKENWTSTEKLIMWFYKEYWLILINNYGLTHTPYDFLGISKSLTFGTYIPLFEFTKKFETSGHELSLTPTYFSDDRVYFDNDWKTDYWVFRGYIKVHEKSNKYVFEYNDWSETYLILKTKIIKNGIPTYIYLGAKKKEKKFPNTTYNFSTNIINHIKGNWLDSKIVSNTIQLWNFGVTTAIDLHGIPINTELLLESSNKDEIILTTKLYNVPLKTVYVSWKKYYIIKAESRSWKSIWFASESTKWPFTTTLFNKIGKEFCENLRNTHY